MATWNDVIALLNQQQTVYLAIKPKTAGGYYNDLQNIAKKLNTTVASLRSLNPDIASGNFPQNDVDYTPILVGGGGEPVPDPGPDPEPGDFIFNLANNQCPLPAGSYYVSQEYGENGHGGSDLACPGGTVVSAVQQGSVITTQIWDGHTTSGNQSWGTMVVLQHIDDTGQTYYTLYAHCQSLSVAVGQTVAKGQQIALSGNTGNVSGSGGGYHLHLEVWVGGYGTAFRTNPRNYVPF